MSKPTVTYQRYKTSWSNHNLERKKTDNGTDWGGGYYVNPEGHAVRIYWQNDNKGEYRKYTGLHMTYKGYCYSKTYEVCFSDRGLMRIANVFIKEVISGKADELI